MLIVISGAHGIGKSTTAELVAKKLQGEYLTEALDEIVPPPRFGPKSPEKIEGQLWHIRQLLLKEKRIVDSSKIYIFDRGWSDVYVYTKILLEPNQRDMILSLIEAIPKHIPDIHIIVTANVSSIKKRIMARQRENLSNWGEDDLNYLKQINQEFINFAKAFSDLRPVYLVDIDKSPEENAEKVVEIIKSHL